MVAPSLGDSNLVWVLLAYRVPREPSTPRIAIWRRLKKLGVAQIGEGLVALPEDARTREALEWVADDVLEAGGTATVWQARLTTRAAEREVIARMAGARTSEYDALIGKANALLSHETASSAERMRRLRLLRRELRAINRRDFFPPPSRDRAHTALMALTRGLRDAQDAGTLEPTPPGVGAP